MKYKYSLGFLIPGEEIDPSGIMSNSRIIAMQPGKQGENSGFWLLWETPC